MREELLALEKKLRNDIHEFAKENSNKSIEEILTMLGLEYTLKDGVYSFTASEIDTRELIYMTYDGTWLNVHNTRDGKPVSIDSAFYCPAGKELIIEILFATTYSNNLVCAMMEAMDRAIIINE
jgi:hypothetical protein